MTTHAVDTDPVADAEAHATQAAADLATAQATLDTAEEELAVATVQEAQTREQYHAHEAARLRHGNSDGDGGERDTLRHAWTEARCAAEALADVITSLRADVDSAQHAARDAATQFDWHTARAAWNALVPEQHAAMQHLHHGLRELQTALNRIGEVATAQAVHAEVLGVPANVQMFQRRALRWWLEYRLGDIVPQYRVPPEIHRWLTDQPLENLNPFAQRAPALRATGSVDDQDDAVEFDEP